jgi:L-amino acid N-acyltransferase YncA
MPTALVHTRPATLEDVDAVVALHDRCSAETLRRRFHIPVSRVAPRFAEELISPKDGWSVLAEQCGEVVGLASAGPLSPTCVEVGLLVEDLFQGSGAGSRMLRDLAEEASVRGFRSLVCLVEADNESVFPTVRRAGLDGALSLVDGLLEVVAPLPAEPRF